MEGRGAGREVGGVEVCRIWGLSSNLYLSRISYPAGFLIPKDSVPSYPR